MAYSNNISGGYRRTPVAMAIGLVLAGAQLATGAEDSGELGEVTVTGSRIQQAVGMSTPTPVASLSAAELQAMAPASITEALTQLPQFYGGATAENFGGAGGVFFTSPGGGSLNLRGIGSKRTLTLLDGRRMVSSTAYGGPDISMFPDEMLKRVETVTGGASAAYGTDAVSGVVNYILDTDFEGFRASAQTGVTDRHDGKNYKYSLAVGHALTDRLHLLFSAGYSKQDEIIGYEGRDWYNGCGLHQNPGVLANVTVPAATATTPNASYIPGNGGYAASTPLLVPGCDLHSTTITKDGLFTIGGVRYTLQKDGSAIPFRRTLPTTGVAANSGVQPGGGGENFAFNDTAVLPSSSRNNIYTYLDYDVSDNLNVYVQGMLGNQTLRTFGRVGDFSNGPPPQALTIYRNNAFLPAQLAAMMDAAGLTTPGSNITLTRAGSDLDWGSGSYANISQTRVGTIGFRSKIASDGFFSDWTVDGYAQYGRNRLDAAQEDGIRLDRVYLATDAVRAPDGSIRCNVTVTSGLVPDCVPLNVFGRGNASAAAVDWIQGFDPGISVTTNPFLGFNGSGAPIYGAPYSYVGDADKHRLLTLTQKVAEISASGKVADGWAGEINAAFGVHYRKEGIDQKVQAPQGNSAADPTYFPVWCPDTALTNVRCVSQISRGIRPPGAIGVRNVAATNPYQNSVEIQFSNVPFIAGSFDVKEAFAETVVPLLSGLPWMKKLNFQGAARWANYAGSGNIWSYKAGLDASFTDEIRLRGTYSHDTRAANISERFDRTGGFTLGLTDRVTPVPAGWVQGVSAATRVLGGNPDVNPEQADTYTFGVVYQPDWLPGFDMSVDWLRVSLTDAIEILAAQRVIDLCYLEGDQDQCNVIVRDPATNQILFIPEVYQNLSKARTEAVDVEMGYSHPVRLFGGSERLGLRVFASYLIENSTTSALGVKSDTTGSVPLQYFKEKINGTLTYSNGPFRWNLQARYLGGGKLNTSYNVLRANLGGPGVAGVLWNVADNSIGSTVHFDTRVGYDVPMGESGSLELFANVTNLFDRDPPIVRGENNSLQTGPAYDQLGRRYVVGVNLRF